MFYKQFSIITAFCLSFAFFMRQNLFVRKLFIRLCLWPKMVSFILSLSFSLFPPNSLTPLATHSVCVWFFLLALCKPCAKHCEAHSKFVSHWQRGMLEIFIYVLLRNTIQICERKNFLIAPSDK